MAGKNAGEVSVRFSVENAEVVRQALANLGKDGDKALKQLEAAAQPAAKSIGAISEISSQARGKVQEWIGQLGPAGAILRSIGPAGLAAGAAIGGLVVAFNAAAEKAEEFAEKSKRLREAAETAGLTITQFKLLSSAGGKVGLDSDQTSAFIERLTVNLDELRRGGGALFEQLARIDTGLVRELASARDTAEAIDILVRAFKRLDDQAQKNALAKAIGGRGGLAGGRLLDYVAEQGGLKSIEQGARDAGKAIDEGLVERTAKLKIEIDAIRKRTDNIWGGAFSEEVLQQQKRSAEFWQSIAEAAERFFKAKSNAPAGGVGGPDDFTLPPGFSEGERSPTRITVTPAAPHGAPEKRSGPGGSRTRADAEMDRIARRCDHAR
jgi:hypothetical protein